MRYRTAVCFFLLISSVIITSCGQTNNRYQSNVPLGSVYVFQDDHSSTYYVANKTKVIRSLAGQAPVFSPDGRYVVSSTNVAVYLYDLRTKIRYTRSFIYDPNCMQQFAANSISDKYLYIADPKLIRYTLPGFSPGVTVPAHLPAGPICPIGHIGNDALVIVGAEKGWELYEVSPEGVSHHLGQSPLWINREIDPNTFFIYTDRAANGDPCIAFDYWAAGGLGFLIKVLDLRTNHTFQVDDTELGLPLVGRGAASDAYVEDMWWSGDGHLYAIMSSYNKSTVKWPQQIWRLSGHKWIAWDSRQLVSERPLNNGTSIVMESGMQDSAEYPGVFGGSLYLETKSGKKLLWRKAYDSIIIPSDEAGNPPRRR